jgi:peptidoglycan/LPS O-acetylase OafA/YrhL
VPDFRGAGSTGGYPYAYDACILRYFAAIAVGMWLAIDDDRVARRRLVVVALAVPSLAYIAVAGTDPAALPSFVHGFTLATNFGAVPWAAAMLLAALHLWPTHSVPGTGWLERLGVASYEVFLMQFIWLGVLTDRGQVPFVVAAIASGLLGWGLHRVLTAAAVGSLGVRRGSLARSQARSQKFAPE